MILKQMHPNTEDGSSSEYFDALRQKNYEASFEGVKEFINKNSEKIHRPHRRTRLRTWQWVAAVLMPLLVVLACTKTEHTEPVGNTIAFLVAQDDNASRNALQDIIGDYQMVFSQDKQKPGYLTYTCFVPAESSQSAETIVGKLRDVKGLSNISSVPMTAAVRESLLSQLGSKIFRTHVDASSMSDQEVQDNLRKQLKEKGFNQISVTVDRDEKGVRRLRLQPMEGSPNYSVDVSISDKGTNLVLQEEWKTVRDSKPASQEAQPDFGSMSDAQVRAYVRKQQGKDIPDGDIKISRAAGEITIEVKAGESKEEVMKFKLK